MLRTSVKYVSIAVFFLGAYSSFYALSQFAVYDNEVQCPGEKHGDDSAGVSLNRSLNYCWQGEVSHRSWHAQMGTNEKKLAARY